jgi:hypothetical protein
VELCGGSSQGAPHVLRDAERVGSLEVGKALEDAEPRLTRRFAIVEQTFWMSSSQIWLSAWWLGTFFIFPYIAWE